MDVVAYVSKTLWHSRLGHPVDQVIGVLQKELEMSKDSHVSPCYPHMFSMKSKKQATLSRSSTEVEYRCMVSATYEIIWICNILSKFSVTSVLPVEMYCDNISPLQLAANPVFYEKSKHFEIDLHLIREKVPAGVVKTI
ncbi:ribonuclease H-like domain-containing protein [Tanacetum coccineum]